MGYQNDERIIRGKIMDYKIANISLAEWGRKEIEIAETEMPG